MCRNWHIVAQRLRSIPAIVFNPVLNSSINSPCSIAVESQPRWRSISFGELLHISTIREAVVCPTCQLKQFERGNGKCRRCQHSLGVTYIEICLPSTLKPLTSQAVNAIRKEVGGLIRRLRFRRQLTQAGLASLTGIHRTYLSRAERGQVMPSILTLVEIAIALGVDKVLLRVHNSPKQ
jgi:DNA-binding XRE family transcriptional regulator